MACVVAVVLIVIHRLLVLNVQMVIVFVCSRLDENVLVMVVALIAVFVVLGIVVRCILKRGDRFVDVVLPMTSASGG
jgi:hypothetical protein